MMQNQLHMNRVTQTQMIDNLLGRCGYQGKQCIPRLVREQLPFKLKTQQDLLYGVSSIEDALLQLILHPRGFVSGIVHCGMVYRICVA